MGGDDASGSDSSDEGYAENSSRGGAQGLLRRDRSMKLEAQFLRTLACRAGVLGGVAARGDGGGSAMDVDHDNKGGAGSRVGGVRGEGIGRAVPGHLVRRLEVLAVRMVEKYALLSHKDRELACRGLCQLWLSLSGPGQGDSLRRSVSAVFFLGWYFWRGCLRCVGDDDACVVRQLMMRRVDI